MSPADGDPQVTPETTSAPPPAAGNTAPPPNGAAPTTPPPAPPATPPQNWSDDWRTKLARGDDKALQHLGRYQSPEAVYDALRSVQKEVDSRGLRPAQLPADATPEQVAEYRKTIGVPETPDKYDLTLPNGLVVGEADKPLVDSFLKAMHDGNATPAEVKRGLAWYYSQQEALAEAQADRDADVKVESVAELGKRWGGEYKVNVRVMDTVLDEAPAAVKDAILGARLANGKLFGADADVLDWLVGIAKIKYPNPSAIGGSTDTNIATAQARVNELTALSGDANSEYWKGPRRQALQDELLKLNEGISQARRLRGM